ncbi:MAG TPA: lysophospholipid acyltransferase family protein [Candidatus Limnocylindrales bacterium]|nr:lysophospholipid acyltransferase family protein [Candidatus Limnocylindrales bacterium]
MTAKASRAAGRTGRWLRARSIELVAGLVERLPEDLAFRLADVAGAVAYRVARARRERARRNLGRVCRWLAANDLGTPPARRASADERALERLVRLAFRHHARYYVEVARTPILDAAYLRNRLIIETPDTVEEAFAASPPAVFVGLHFGAIELPAVLFAERVGRDAVAPMEELADDRLNRWFVRTRGAAGIRIVGLREARRELSRALAHGHPVGLVGDRDLTGGGIRTQLFGAPTSLPAGPALLALESGSPIYVAAVRRVGSGRYRGRLEALETPPPGPRRERVVAVLESEARAFERLISDAPEQWWAVFAPIWPDLDDLA